MDIGIDIEGLRCIPRSGLYYYVWNVLHQMCQLDHPHRMNLFLRGEPLAHGRKQIVRFLKEASSETTPAGLAASKQVDLPLRDGGGSSRHVWLQLKQMGRGFLLPLAKRIAATKSPDFAVLRQVTTSANSMDLCHYSYGVRVPLRAKVGVMTLPDLIPRRFPEYCTSEIVAYSETIFQSARSMDLILTYSEHSKRDIVELVGVDAGRVRVTPLGAHDQYRAIECRDEVETVLARYGLAGRPYILNIGNLEPRKNLRRLLKAFHCLRNEARGLDYELVLVGARGWMEGDIFETIRGLHLEPVVRWLGYVPFEDLPALLNGASLFIFPSLYEGFGLPALEAMACGVPVVASRVSSLPEVVGDAGILVDPYEVRDVAEGMRRVLTDWSLRRSLRARGLARARMFSWEKTARLTLSAYEEAWARA